MGFSDPQTVNSVSHPKVSWGDHAGVFQAADGTTKLSISHSFTKGRVRRVARFDYNSVVADPLGGSPTNIPLTQAVYLVYDEDSRLYTSRAAALATGTALTSWLTASTNANFITFLSGQS
jgi:hypothetical protein